MYSVASIVFWVQNTARQGKSPLQPQIKNGKSDTNVYRNVTEKGDDKMKYILPNGEIIEANDELAKLLAEIKELLANMTKEERLSIFKENEYPKDMDFDYDFGNTVIEVRTFFEGSKDYILPMKQREKNSMREYLFLKRNYPKERNRLLILRNS